MIGWSESCQERSFDHLVGDPKERWGNGEADAVLRLMTRS
jgi:hypothetical protein